MIGFHRLGGTTRTFLLLALFLLAGPAFGVEGYMGITRSDLGAGDHEGVVLGMSFNWVFAGSPFSLRMSLEYYQKGGEVQISRFNSGTGEWENGDWEVLHLSYLQAKACPEVALFSVGGLSARVYGGIGLGSLARRSLGYWSGNEAIDALLGGIKDIDLVRVLGAKLVFQGLFLDAGWDQGLLELEGDPPLPGQVHPFSLDGIHNHSCHLALGVAL